MKSKLEVYPGLAALLTLTLMVAFGCRRESKEVLTIAVAANMQFAADSLMRSFSWRHKVPCEMAIGSSGKLTAQIIEGAPFDVLLSADMKYPEELHNKGLTERAPSVYAYGRLVLWTASDTLKPAIDALQKDHVHHIALANPKTAPYGVAAMAALNHFGIFDAVKDKLVYGESIAQTNQFILSGAAEVGFTAMAVVLSKPAEETGSWETVDPSAYAAIAQGIALIKRQGRRKMAGKAGKFQEFLFSAEGKEILHAFGYLTD